MDQIERGLQDLHEQTLAVWRHHNCLECPMGETAALASALLTFYQLNTSQGHPATEPPHWSHKWRRDLA